MFNGEMMRESGIETGGLVLCSFSIAILGLFIELRFLYWKLSLVGALYTAAVVNCKRCLMDILVNS